MTANNALTSRNSGKLPRLSDTALVILCNAAQREDRLLFPVPSSLAASPEAMKKTINVLKNKGLVEERPAKLEDVIWRTDEQEQHKTLGITEAGIAVINGDAVTTDTADAGSTSRKRSPSKAGKGKRPGGVAKSKKPASTSKSGGGGQPKSLKTRNNTKASQILVLLRRANGATIAEMTKATGWQVHSIRGFLSGTVKKRMGLKLTSEQAEGKDRRYKIPAKA